MFERSHLELETDRGRWWLALLAMAFLVAWGAWSLYARVDVHRVSLEARVERPAHRLEAVVAGRIERVSVVVGQRVEVGDELLALDASAERLERRRVEAQIDATRAEIERIDAQRLARLRVREQGKHWSRAIARQEKARVHAAEERTSHTKQRAKKLEYAAALDAVPQQSVADAQHEAQQERSTKRQLVLGLDVLSQEAELAAAREDAELAQLQRDSYVARGQLQILEVERQRIETRIAAMRVLSPIAGDVASTASLQPGAYLEAGAEVAVVVPSSDLRVVAWLPLDGTVGWVQPGQPARVRLHDFPWTRWGSVPATVERLAREPSDGRVRVELELDATRTEIPLDHGLPCSVEIAVDSVSPVELVLRAAGRRMGGRSQPSAEE